MRTDGVSFFPEPFCRGSENNAHTDNGIILFYLNHNNVQAFGCVDECPVNMVIPESVSEEKVTSIGRDAFRSGELNSVIIPSTITSVGDDAFRQNKLTSVAFLGPRPDIGLRVFNGNRNLLSITFCSGEAGWPGENINTGTNSLWPTPVFCGPFLDTDGDGVRDNQDVFPSNPDESVDTDNDGIGNNTDTDDDNDGVADESDAFPLDTTETTDSDYDGVGDNADVFPLDAFEHLDSDGDSIGDNKDAFPFNALEGLDTDSDGIGNNVDTDDDGDGVLDSFDMYPLNSANQLQKLHDIDGNGSVDVLTDLMLIMRYGFGFNGEALIDGAIAEDASRTTSAEIEAYLEALIPEL